MSHHLTAAELEYLAQCVELAEKALSEGNAPFGSILVDGRGKVLFKDYNRVNSTKDCTRHPEIEIARWASQHLTAEQAKKCTVYTSGEHCSMCSTAHALAALGRIVYASSSAQLRGWYKEWGMEPPPVAHLPIESVVINADVSGPAPELTEHIKSLQQKYLRTKTII